MPAGTHFKLEPVSRKHPGAFLPTESNRNAGVARLETGFRIHDPRGLGPFRILMYIVIG